MYMYMFGLPAVYSEWLKTRDARIYNKRLR